MFIRDAQKALPIQSSLSNFPQAVVQAVPTPCRCLNFVYCFLSFPPSSAPALSPASGGVFAASRAGVWVARSWPAPKQPTRPASALWAGVLPGNLWEIRAHPETLRKEHTTNQRTSRTGGLAQTCHTILHCRTVIELQNGTLSPWHPWEWIAAEHCSSARKESPHKQK